MRHRVLTRAQAQAQAHLNRPWGVVWLADWPRPAWSPIWWGAGALAVVALLAAWVRR